MIQPIKVELCRQAGECKRSKDVGFFFALGVGAQHPSLAESRHT